MAVDKCAARVTMRRAAFRQMARLIEVTND